MRIQQSKKDTWFVRLPRSSVVLADKIKTECGYGGRDDLLKHMLELLVAIKTGQGLPPFVDDMKRRRQEQLAQRENANDVCSESSRRKAQGDSPRHRGDGD